MRAVNLDPHRGRFGSFASLEEGGPVDFVVNARWFALDNEWATYGAFLFLLGFGVTSFRL